MTWRWTRPTDPTERELISATCWVAGAVGVWEQPSAVVAYFDERTDDVPAGGSWEREVERDWMAGWREHVQPLILGDVAIVPAWMAADWRQPPETRHVIVLDQGTGFGTGHHATTAGCLAATFRLVRPGDRVADIGCGSGILAIAAALAGAARVIAVDVDDVATDAARRNVAHNDVDVEVLHGSTNLIDEPVDVVLANLLTDTVIRLAAELARITAPGGRLVVSGIGEQRQERVLDALRHTGLRLESADVSEGWLVAVLSNPDAVDGGAAS